MRGRKFFLIVYFSSNFALVGADVSTAIRDALEHFIENKEISGAVTLVARDGEIVSLQATGLSDLSTGRMMEKNDLFRIASMTKPMAGVAIMMLVEEGKLNVDDLVEDHLAEFKNQWMIDERSKDTLTLKRSSRKITIFDLLTHTAGVPNVVEPRSHTTLAELVAQISQQPLDFEPGSRWKYSSAGTNVVGRIVEVVSGQRYEVFLQERLLNPLGMHNTTFFPSKAQLKRTAKSYLKNGDMTELEEIPVPFGMGELWDTQRTVKPSGGLYSTADDLSRFYQMMLNGGEWNGTRLLSEKSVQELTRTQTGDITTGFTDGMSWGLAFQVVKEPQGVTSMLSRGTFGHGGAYGTQSWADPVNQTIYILMVQRRGFQPNGDDSIVRKAFQQTAFDALERG
jgi:CubicO group peptidase (beta-lactamase class C family)